MSRTRLPAGRGAGGASVDGGGAGFGPGESVDAAALDGTDPAAFWARELEHCVTASTRMRTRNARVMLPARSEVTQQLGGRRIASKLGPRHGKLRAWRIERVQGSPNYAHPGADADDIVTELG